MTWNHFAQPFMFVWTTSTAKTHRRRDLKNNSFSLLLSSGSHCDSWLMLNVRAKIKKHASVVLFFSCTPSSVFTAWKTKPQNAGKPHSSSPRKRTRSSSLLTSPDLAVCLQKPSSPHPSDAKTPELWWTRGRCYNNQRSELSAQLLYAVQQVAVTFSSSFFSFCWRPSVASRPYSLRSESNLTV